ncbi:CAF17-like 4Fe-4S cluster assembly/insertion protein YgfZ [Methylococcus capsulatus]|uniref:CAF17-like 4Fe-4S cluster assembly/insertion protein YgfZ n=1 Tax=Methylococcus capsulatus TaxID=414 RepID=UPI001C532A1B|nr:folate-binding protein [Methylococcus capsulatus]QXP89701.1 folate-binding protein [Methylococcus capsulatus]
MAAGEALKGQMPGCAAVNAPAEWMDFLDRRGASGGEGAELALGGDLIADLSHFGLIEVKGEEAGKFLGSMLTGDVRLVSETLGQFTSWCDGKGRIQATFWLFKRGGAYYLLLPEALLPGVITRLKMFLLRTKATITNASGTLARIGLSGAGIADTLGSALPEPRGGTMSVGDCTLLALGGEPRPRWLAVGTSPAVSALWNKAAPSARPAGAGAWALLDILAGIPYVTTETAGEFIPQMLDLEALGGLSYKKGCYPGQEVIARLHYRGQLKRKVFLAHADCPEVPAPGTRLHRPGFDESVGLVVSAAKDGREYPVTMLAVVVLERKAQGDIRLGSADGPLLVFADQDDDPPHSDAGC